MSETLADIGEFDLIHRIHRVIQQEGVSSPDVVLGIGDDAASLRPRVGYELLITCDSMLEGRHYLPQHISSLDLGRRAMAVNISDIGAMGGHPRAALVSLGLRADALVADIEAMYRGFAAELNPFQASIIGGNLTKTGDAMFIDITLIGEVEPAKLVRRSTARVGDAILVTGYPGQAAAGLQLLLQSQPSEDLHEHPLVRAYHTPIPRAREGRTIACAGYVTAMIDTSDGFLGDLGHICQNSMVGAVLFQEQFPLSAELQIAAGVLARNPYDLFLRDSDDYELIITCAPEHIKLAQSVIANVSDVPVTEVGKITKPSEGIQLVLPDGTQRPLTPTGWDHFA